ncbi:YbaK/EbsC family protein [Lutimaribacter marinistellae]|uniref:YbaK/EbsC family protein n=1 Tax=Lutimaribacter marinistellae TaxID=1820329 RepID=A0ABV7TIE6_9RHOB
MSKSLKRVRAALEDAGLSIEVRQTDNARTAEDAARAVGCDVNQIAKSIIFWGERSDAPVLFLTAGGNQVDTGRAAEIADEKLSRAKADRVRTTTGFAIGGVAPIGHLTPIRAFFDPKLLEFEEVWAAAGTPQHVFAISPKSLVELAGARVAPFTGDPSE